MDEQQRKWLVVLAWCVVILILFFRLDMCSSCSSEDEQQDETDTELVEESEADRQAREQKEEAARQAQERKERIDKQEQLKKEYADEGYRRGYDAAFSTPERNSNWDYRARNIYTTFHHAPSTPEEKELYDIFYKNYMKGVNDVLNSR